VLPKNPGNTAGLVTASLELREKRMRFLVEFFATLVAKLAIELIDSRTFSVFTHHAFEAIVLPHLR
jgi:hypothetical protein